MKIAGQSLDVGDDCTSSLRCRDHGLKSGKTVSMLKQVLETFTDVTRYPR